MNKSQVTPFFSRVVIQWIIKKPKKKKRIPSTPEIISAQFSWSELKHSLRFIRYTERTHLVCIHLQISNEYHEKWMHRLCWIIYHWILLGTLNGMSHRNGLEFYNELVRSIMGLVTDQLMHISPIFVDDDVKTYGRFQPEITREISLPNRRAISAFEDPVIQERFVLTPFLWWRMNRKKLTVLEDLNPSWFFDEINRLIDLSMHREWYKSDHWFAVDRSTELIK